MTQEWFVSVQCKELLRFEFDIKSDLLSSQINSYSTFRLSYPIAFWRGQVGGHLPSFCRGRGSTGLQNGSCHFIDDQIPSSNQEVEVCLCWRLWSVWLTGWSVVGLEWSGSSHQGALRQQWQARALTDSGHYHLLSAPFASGQEHLTLPVVTKCCTTAGSKVKYSLSRSGGFPLQ